jgi:arabinose-5-phosphate isomerase
LLADTLVELSDKRCGCLLVVDDQGRLLGIFTDGDLRRALQTDGGEVLQRRMGDLMTPSAKWTNPKEMAWDAMQLMESDQQRPITVLPVLDGVRLVGLVRMHDLVQAGI